jgi:hypothetical protein
MTRIRLRLMHQLKPYPTIDPAHHTAIMPPPRRCGKQLSLDRNSTTNATSISRTASVRHPTNIAQPMPPRLPPQRNHRTSLPTTVAIDLHAEQVSDSLLATLSQLPSITDSVMHVVCSPHVCGVHTDHKSSTTIRRNPTSTNRMIDGGSNLCVTGDLGSLLNVVNIEPITILVALKGAPESYNDCITKRGLLPLSLSNGTTYYQACFYCANMVEKFISPAAVLASSDVFYSWT